MDIKEIALKHSREYLTFKLGGRKGLDVAEIVCDDEIYAEIVDELAQQFEALIESYKAELLKEVGEPVLYAEFAEDGGWLGDASEYADHLEEPHALFTSDQVAAAILKATKPLEDQLAKAEQRVAEWQPISTAPKDGTDILVMYMHIDTQVVHNAFWNDYEDASEDEIGWWSYEHSEVSRIKLDDWMSPTHWMPLPKAPNGASS